MTVEETYYHSEYLVAFADKVANSQLGTRRIGKWKDDYSFSHPYYDGLKLTTKQIQTDILNATICQTVLRGEPNQIKEFIRAANSHLDNLIDSRKYVAKNGHEK